MRQRTLPTIAQRGRHLLAALAAAVLLGVAPMAAPAFAGTTGSPASTAPPASASPSATASPSAPAPAKMPAATVPATAAPATAPPPSTVEVAAPAPATDPSNPADSAPPLSLPADLTVGTLGPGHPIPGPNTPLTMAPDGSLQPLGQVPEAAPTAPRAPTFARLAPNAAAPYAAATGAVRAIAVTVVTVQLADNSPADTAGISLAAVKTGVDTASTYWKSMSNNRISMTVAKTVTGFKSAATTYQNYNDIMNKVATEYGWVQKPGTVLMVVVANSDLYWGGSGGILGATWSNGTGDGLMLMPAPSTLTNNVTTHEFGHVLGLLHADALECTDGRADVGINSAGNWSTSACSSREYGDTTDLMGFAQYNLPVINSYFWDMGNFGRGDEVFDAGTAKSGQTFTLRAWGGTAANRAVKITDAGSGETYYFELRVPVGYDKSIAVDGNRGVKIVKADLAKPWALFSLRLAPSTLPFSGYYNPNQAWQAGQTFVSHTGMTVQINNISNTDASITVTASSGAKSIAEKATATSALGSATSGVVCGLAKGGCYQTFQRGAILWSYATGAHTVTNSIRQTWRAYGSEGGRFGYPTTDEVGGLRSGGVYQMFEGGAIIWTPATGPHISTGANRQTWGRFGFENGQLGYPTTDEIAGLANGGVYQLYQGGAIYWSPASGSHAVTGGIGATWKVQGSQNGQLRYPTSDEAAGLVRGGYVQSFQGGAIYWTPATGSHISQGGIRAAWGTQGYQDGRLGYPTTNEYPLSGGVVGQDYQGGRIIWTPGVGIEIQFAR
ncbi:zinc-dependent metalloprotease family protein [Pseudarthrobacter sp. P1]|uniref:zinc-dependent metalloprotease family protein n=1 Tax=Pseudarthrobacter sp. P1 TaxID=3418418 RepID=UPI003CF99382